MLKDLDEVVLGAESFRSVFVEERQNQIGDAVREIDFVLLPVREHHWRVLDLHLQNVPILVPERRHSDQHLVQQDADGPPVDTEVVSRLIQHFWRHVFGSTADCGRQFVILKHFSQAEINQLDIAVLIEQDIFQFEVSVSDSSLVQVPEAKNDLSGIELDSLLRKTLLLAEDLVELCSSDEGHDEVQAHIILV